MVSYPTSRAVGRHEGKVEKENKEVTNSSHDGEEILPRNLEAGARGSTPQYAPHNPENIRQEEAATKAQAAFRGYLVIFSH